MNRSILFIFIFCGIVCIGNARNNSVSSRFESPSIQSESSSSYNEIELSLSFGDIIEKSKPEPILISDLKMDIWANAQLINGHDQVGFNLCNVNIPYLIRKDECFLSVLRI